MKLITDWKYHTAVLFMVATLFVLFAVSAVSSQAAVPTIACGDIVTEDGQIAVPVIVDFAGNPSNQVRMEMVFDTAVLTYTDIKMGADFDIDFGSGSLDDLAVAIFGRSAGLGAADGIVQFATVTFAWAGEPTTITFNQGDLTGLEKGSLAYFVGNYRPLQPIACPIGHNPPILTPTSPPTDTSVPTMTPTPYPTSTPPPTVEPIADELFDYGLDIDFGVVEQATLIPPTPKIVTNTVSITETAIVTDIILISNTIPVTTEQIITDTVSVTETVQITEMVDITDTIIVTAPIVITTTDVITTTETVSRTDLITQTLIVSIPIVTTEAIIVTETVSITLPVVVTKTVVMTETIPAPTGLIDGVIWHDLDRSGEAVLSAGDIPLSGVTIRLLYGDRIIADAITDENGAYRFADLRLNFPYTVLVDAEMIPNNKQTTDEPNMSGRFELILTDDAPDAPAVNFSYITADLPNITIQGFFLAGTVVIPVVATPLPTVTSSPTPLPTISSPSTPIPITTPMPQPLPTAPPRIITETVVLTVTELVTETVTLTETVTITSEEIVTETQIITDAVVVTETVDITETVVLTSQAIVSNTEVITTVETVTRAAVITTTNVISAVDIITETAFIVETVPITREVVTTNTVIITETITEPLGTISGVMKHEAAAGVRLLLLLDETPILETTTDEDGAYRFDDLPLGYSYGVIADPDTLPDGKRPLLLAPFPAQNIAEDQLVLTVDLTYVNGDYGDLPESYGTSGVNAPFHASVSDEEQIRLGGDITAEANSQPSLNAFSDIDEGLNHMTPCRICWFEVIIEGNVPPDGARLGLWIDWDHDGAFSQTEFEQYVVLEGVNAIQLTKPDAYEQDALAVRLRLFDPTHLPNGTVEWTDFEGATVNGEVEDYVLFGSFFVDPTSVAIHNLASRTIMPVHLLAAVVVLLLATSIGRIIQPKHRG